MKINIFFGKHIIKAITVALATMMTMSPITAVAQGGHNVDAEVAFSPVEHSTSISDVDTEFFSQAVVVRKSIDANQVIREEVVEITDEETALAPTIPAEERAKTSWWWLLIIAICGATSYVWYRNHQKRFEGEDLEV